MNKKILFLAIFCAPLVFLVGFFTAKVSLDSSNNPINQISEIPDSDVTPSPDKQQEVPSKTTPAPRKIKLTMYIPDSGLLGYETKTVYVSATTPATDIVGRMLNQENILPSAVSLIGYSITVNKNRVATIDLKSDPNSERKISSAASGEVFKLGSLNETLTKNSRLNINQVELTENGEELTFGF